MSDLYKTLELDKDADEGEIRKAYKRLALLWHPDRNKDKIEEAEQKFKEISEAYQVLSDPEKKRVYDSERLNSESFFQKSHTTQPNNGFNPHDLFNMFFQNNRDNTPFHGNFHFPNIHVHHQNNGSKKGQTKIDSLQFTLKELYTGGKKKVTIKILDTCSHCNGAGGINVRSCGNCQGNGIIRKVNIIGPGLIQTTQTMCHQCSGSGKIIENLCQQCNGKKLIVILKSFLIDLPPSAKDNDKYIFEKEGNASEDGGERGDVIFVIKESPYSKFERKENDLYYTYDILLGDSLIGSTIEFEHLNGQNIRYFESGIIQYNSKRKIANLGFLDRSTNSYGDLYIVYNIKYPIYHELNEEQKNKIREIFPCLDTKEQNSIDIAENNLLKNSELIKNND